MTVLLVVVTVASVIACMVQRSRVRDLRTELASETQWAATYKQDAVRANKQCIAANLLSREQADRIADLEEQLRDARDEVERLLRTVG